MEKRILLTGAAGFIGSRILKRLLTDTAFDGLILGMVDSRRTAWHWSDVPLTGAPRISIDRLTEFDPAAVGSRIEEFRPTTLIHLAAFGLNPDQVNSLDNWSLNFDFTMAILEKFIDSGGRRFVFAGSCFEYGRPADGNGIGESQVCSPISVYGRSKLRATEGILHRAENTGIEAVVLRPFHAYGPSENPHRVVAYLIRSSLRKEAATLNTGEQVRDFVFVDDVANAFLLAATQPLPQPRRIYNVSTGTGTSIRGVANLLDAFLPEPASREWGKRDARPDEIAILVGRNDAIRSDLGWNPTRNLEEGLRETVDWHRRHGAIYEALPEPCLKDCKGSGNFSTPVRPELSILCPVYNEEKNVERVYDAIRGLLTSAGIPFELIFSDNRSEDRSWQLVEALAATDARVKGIRLSRNFGYQSSISNALMHCSGNGIVIIDADLQDPPEMILTFYEKWKQERYDVVYGIRIQRKGEPFWRRVMIDLFYRLLNRMSEIPIPLGAGDFRLMDRRVVGVLNEMPEQDRYIRGMIAWAGFRQFGIPYVRREREFGESKFPFSKMVSLGLDGIVGFSMKPLRLGLFASGLMILVAVLLGAYALCVHWVSRPIPGWTSMMITVCFFLSIQFFILGLIGEYLGRIYRQVKGRPLFVVDERVGFPNMVQRGSSATDAPVGR